ncbi:MAG: hypothetical protein JWP03_3579 [Phycisphaerales bacterium]|nr:hypothetical protein [Phycisphaerales bacterium]
MKLLAFFLRLFHHRPSRGDNIPVGVAPKTVEGDDAPVWGVAANVAMEHRYGPGGAETRRGTKHFAPGAKVFVYEFMWGYGGTNVTVVGRHRKSKRFIRITMPSNRLVNWRAELVYSPYIAKQFRDSGEFGKFAPGSEDARRHAEEIVAGYIARGTKSQPFLTRPPRDEGA